MIINVCSLDMWIELSHGILITTLYENELDRNTFLLASRAPPRALMYGLPERQFYGLRCLCHSNDEFIEKAATMKTRFWTEATLDSVLMRLTKLHFQNPALISHKKVSKKITTFPPSGL